MKKQTVVFVVLVHSQAMGCRALESFSKILLLSGYRNNMVKAEYLEESLLTALEYEVSAKEVDRDYLFNMAEGYFGLSLEFIKYYAEEEVKKE